MEAPILPSAETSTENWALTTFGLCDFGNIARTQAVIRYAAIQAKLPAASTDAACGRDSAAAESAHRMLRNNHVGPQMLNEGACLASWQRAADLEVVLGIEDTTGQSFGHSVAEELGNQNGSEDPTRRGWMVHSVILLDGKTHEPLGLGYQHWWCRPDRRPGTAQRKRRPYEEKESFKWQKASERMAEMADLSNVISVCDREADIALYLEYKLRNRQRFVVRSSQSRSIVVSGSTDTLHEYITNAPFRGAVNFVVPQGHGVPERECTATIQFERVALNGLKGLSDNTVTVVRVREFDAGKLEPLEWILVTSEPVESLADALEIIVIYKQRWQIEVFHRTWKTGCGAKNRRLLRADNLQRLLIILAHIAVFIMKMKHLAATVPDEPCDRLFSQDEWECLHALTEPNKPMPTTPPSCVWAVRAIAKLAGWRNSKGTGAISAETLWNGWFLFQAHVTGWRLAKRAAQR